MKFRKVWIALLAGVLLLSGVGNSVSVSAESVAEEVSANDAAGSAVEESSSVKGAESEEASGPSSEMSATVSGGDGMTAGDAGDTGSEELDYVLGRPMTEEEQRQQRELFDYYTNLGGGVIPPEEVPENNVLPASMQEVWGTLPAQYDSRNVNGRNLVPEIRDQAPYGTCWSFSSIACLEINLIKNGLADRSVDLSELHLAFFSNYSAPDPLGNDGDARSYYDITKAPEDENGKKKSYLNVGGNQVMAGHALMNWKGAAHESLVTGDMAEAGLDAEDSGLAYGNDIYYLKNWYRLPATDEAAMKAAIMQYGSVGISYYSGGVYFNSETAAQYCPDPLRVTHAVTIIGWDDSFRRQNFGTQYEPSQPKRDGAWLVRNSWGEGHGDGGYFWLSYEDKSIYNEAYAFEGQRTDAYDNNYQYDHATGSGYLDDLQQVANVYKAKANGNKLEELKAVGISLFSAGVSYSVQIYTNLTDISDPLSGDPALAVPLTGVTGYAGYYVIPLNESILLDPGDTFSVVFDFRMGSEATASVECEYPNTGYRHSESEINPGESFCLWRGGGWTDISEKWDDFKVNLKVKAYTGNTDIEQDLVRSFAKRMYTKALRRKADAAGLADWTSRLKNREIDGAGIAWGFIGSVEFAERRLSDEDFVDTLYRSFFNREADRGGRSNWLQQLASGSSRNNVLSGFVNSEEFTVLCDRYGIARGTMQGDGSTIYRPGVRDFVLRLYVKALNRQGETMGVEDWTNQINIGQKTPEEVAKGFFFSEEFVKKNLSNADYVETLYQTFMDRASDPGGKADWVERLKNGMSREQVLEGFSRSAEFGKIMAAYGL